MDTLAPARVLVTGGAGFIGSNLVRYLLETHPDAAIVNLDALTYAGSRETLEDVERRFGPTGEGRYRFVLGDICDSALVNQLLEEGVDAIVHAAAETHVDRSILGPEAFIRTNVNGAFTLLEAAKTHWSGRQDVRFINVSTDEVYGSRHGEPASEQSPYQPNSPYSASKASADHLARAYYVTYGLPTITTHCANNYGPAQFPEKLLPFMIVNALDDQPLGIYGDGQNVRDWLYVIDHCRALDLALRQGRPGETYNIAANQERKNIDVVHGLCGILDELRPRADGASYRRQIRFVTDRPGHDREYRIDATKIRSELGWKPKHVFEKGLRSTVEWCLAHVEWLLNASKRRLKFDFAAANAKKKLE
jgi:dTDP-glucose 4,6-dehydratase